MISLVDIAAVLLISIHLLVYTDQLYRTILLSTYILGIYTYYYTILLGVSAREQISTLQLNIPIWDIRS